MNMKRVLVLCMWAVASFCPAACVLAGKKKSGKKTHTRAKPKKNNKHDDLDAFLEKFNAETKKIQENEQQHQYDLELQKQGVMVQWPLMRYFSYDTYWSLKEYREKLECLRDIMEAQCLWLEEVKCYASNTNRYATSRRVLVDAVDRQLKVQLVTLEERAFAVRYESTIQSLLNKGESALFGFNQEEQQFLESHQHSPSPYIASRCVYALAITQGNRISRDIERSKALAFSPLRIDSRWKEPVFCDTAQSAIAADVLSLESLESVLGKFLRIAPIQRDYIDALPVLKDLAGSDCTIVEKPQVRIVLTMLKASLELCQEHAVRVSVACDAVKERVDRFLGLIDAELESVDTELKFAIDEAKWDKEVEEKRQKIARESSKKPIEKPLEKPIDGQESREKSVLVQLVQEDAPVLKIPEKTSEQCLLSLQKLTGSKSMRTEPVHVRSHPKFYVEPTRFPYLDDERVDLWFGDASDTKKVIGMWEKKYRRTFSLVEQELLMRLHGFSREVDKYLALAVVCNWKNPEHPGDLSYAIPAELTDLKTGETYGVVVEYGINPGTSQVRGTCFHRYLSFHPLRTLCQFVQQRRYDIAQQKLALPNKKGLQEARYGDALEHVQMPKKPIQTDLYVTIPDNKNRLIISLLKAVRQ